MTGDAIPQNIFLRLKEWLEQRKTGQVSLNISAGRVDNAEFKEKLTADRK
jgi:hypothetical protein